MDKKLYYQKGSSIKRENRQLRLRLEEAEETLRAIREGEVDGLIINGNQGEQVYTLVGADHSYRLLIEDMNEGALTLTGDGIILYCNRSFSQMIGMPLQELMGSSFFDFIYPEDRTALSTAMTQNGGKVRREISMHNTRGNTLPVYFSSNPILVDGLDRYSLVITDLTEVHARANKLRASEEKFSRAFNGIPIMMAVVTMDEGRYLDVNEAFCSVSGYSCSELLGRSMHKLDIFLPVDQEESEGELLKKGRVENAEVLMKTKSGNIRNCLSWCELIQIDGKPCSIYGYIDVTEKKQVEKEMARLDRLNLVGEMAASIGHEIRNPMTAIKGFLQLLNEQSSSQDQIYFDIMIEEVDRANKIITEYLNMAKNKTIELGPYDLDNIIEAIYPMLLADANYQEKNINLDLSGNRVAMVDENEIRQLLLNLARNGLEAMEAGGSLTIGTAMKEDETVLFVRDEGSGLPPDIVDKIGTPFLTTKATGTGLGLAVCYSIASRHKACIDFETGSSGTTFFVRFPVSSRDDISLVG